MVSAHTCRNCGHYHLTDEIGVGDNVCKTDTSCMCHNFEPNLPDFPVLNDIDRYMSQFKDMTEKMQWVLLNLKFFRNYNNTEVIFAWWKYINHYDAFRQVLTPDLYFKLDLPESITRTKRLWVEHDKDKYGEFIPTVTEQKIFKQYAIEEYIIEFKSPSRWS